MVEELEQKNTPIENKQEKSPGKPDKIRHAGLAVTSIGVLCAVAAIGFGVSRNGGGNRSGPEDIAAADLSGSYEIETIEAAEEGSTDTLSADDIELMKFKELSLTLELAPDGTGVIDYFGDPMELTYNTETMTVTIDGEDCPFRYEDGKVTIEQNGSEMIFAPAKQHQDLAADQDH